MTTSTPTRAVPCCSLCGLSAYSGAILTRTNDVSGATRLTCTAWCGTGPSPAMTHSQLDTIRSTVSTDLERTLLAEVDLLRSLTRRAEQDLHRIPEYGTSTWITQDPPGVEKPGPAPSPKTGAAGG